MNNYILTSLRGNEKMSL